jgi:rhomboid family GlyGly-CTERM serine protease
MAATEVGVNRQAIMTVLTRRLPWITFSLVGASILLALLPGMDVALEYDRAAVDSGGLWRILTGQFVHWTPRMALADLGVLLLAGAWVEIRSRRLALAALVSSTLFVGAGLDFLIPDLAYYRGSSGVASALFVVVALDLASSSPRRWARPLAAVTLSLFALKLLWEHWTGFAIAAGSLLPGVIVVPQVHLLGGVAGLLAFILHRRHRHSTEHPRQERTGSSAAAQGVEHAPANG